MEPLSPPKPVVIDTSPVPGRGHQTVDSTPVPIDPQPLDINYESIRNLAVHDLILPDVLNIIVDNEVDSFYIHLYNLLSPPRVISTTKPQWREH